MDVSNSELMNFSPIVFWALEVLREKLMRKGLTEFTVEDFRLELSFVSPADKVVTRLTNNDLGLILKSDPGIISLRKSTRRINNGSMVYKFNDSKPIIPLLVKEKDGNCSVNIKWEGFIDRKLMKNALKKNKNFPENWITKNNFYVGMLENEKLLDDIIQKSKNLGLISSSDERLCEIGKILELINKLKINPADKQKLSDDLIEISLIK